MKKLVYVNGRKVVEKNDVFVILNKYDKKVEVIHKNLAKTPKEAVVVFMEREDAKFIKLQDKVWKDYV